eukprot:8255843-Pyramimonas_sp.AAC.1
MSAWGLPSDVASSLGTPSDVLALNMPSYSYSNLSPAHSGAPLFTPASSAPSPSRGSSYKVVPTPTKMTSNDACGKRKYITTIGN